MTKDHYKAATPIMQQIDAIETDIARINKGVLKIVVGYGDDQTQLLQPDFLDSEYKPIIQAIKQALENKLTRLNERLLKI